MTNKMIYMDYQATTPTDRDVLSAMLPYFTEKFGNPHSTDHIYGLEAGYAVEKARKQVADLINADSRDIIFTSGATESNNITIKGVASFYKSKGNHIVTLCTEHKCLLNACRHLESQGIKVTYLPVQNNGIVDLDLLKKSITEKTLMVSTMAVHNEIGVIQPIKEIGAICKERNILFHTDAAQAFGKITLNVEEMNIDLMSISGHKIYGPKGVGALYVRRKPRVKLTPLFHGGGQERGVRSGTVPVPLAVGLGEAAAIAANRMHDDCKYLRKLFDIFYSEINKNLKDVYLNGDLHSRYPGNLNLSFAYIEGESLMGRLKNIAVSSGSACTSESLESSYVLKALGVEASAAHASVRFGLGRYTTEHEIHTVTDKLIKATKELRDMSPLWEMTLEGIDIKKIAWTDH